MFGKLALPYYRGKKESEKKNSLGHLTNEFFGLNGFFLFSKQVYIFWIILIKKLIQGIAERNFVSNLKTSIKTFDLLCAHK